MDTKEVPMSPESLMAATKPLYIMSKLFGIAPFTSRLEASKSAILYSLTLHITLLGIVIKLLIAYVDTYTEGGRRQTFIIPMILTAVVYGIDDFAAFINAAFRGRETLKNSIPTIIEIDKKLFKNHVDYKYVYKILAIELAVMTLGGVLCFTYEMTLHKHHSLLIHANRITTEKVSLLVVVQFVNCVYLLKNRYALVNKKLVSCFRFIKKSTKITGRHVYARLESGTVVPFGLNTLGRSQETVKVSLVARIRTLRILHNQLGHVARVINNFYGFQMLSRITILLISSTNESYSLILSLTLSPVHIQEHHAKYAFLNGVWLLFTALELFAIAYVCHVTSDEAGRTSLLVQDYVLLDNLDNEVAAELNGFARQLSDNKLVFTAHGLFTLDLTLLLAVVGTATTYIIILLQN